MILHRAYLTPYRLHLMYLEVSDCYPRCQATHAKLMHMLWNCPRLVQYWSVIHTLLQGIAPQRNADAPEYCILGLGPKGKKQGPVCRFRNLALILAKKHHDAVEIC